MVCESRSNASAVADGVHPWASSEMAYQTPGRGIQGHSLLARDADPMPEASGELARQPTPGWVDRVIQFARVDLVVPGLIPASYGVGPGKVIFPHRRGRVHDPQVGDGHRYGRTLRFRHIRAPLVISADFRSTIAVPPKLDVEANSLFQSGGAGSQITVYWHSVSWCSSSVLVISGVR